MTFCTDTFEERAAILQFDGGLSRFAAETEAAKAQGLPRWQALKGVEDAKRQRPVVGTRRDADPMGGKRDAGDVPAMQRQPEEENRSMPVGQSEAGRDRDPLLALRAR